MKTLLVYYSRTQITEKIAKTIQKDLDCDIEEITVGDKYDGTIGYIKGGFDASANRVHFYHLLLILFSKLFMFSSGFSISFFVRYIVAIGVLPVILAIFFKVFSYPLPPHVQKLARFLI